MAIRVAPLDDNLDFPEGVQQRQAERLRDSATPEGAALKASITQRSTSGLRLVVAGDSTVAGNEGGVVDQRSSSWPHFLAVASKGRLRLEHNAGRPGWRVDQILASFESDVAVHNPGIVIVLIGRNNITQGYTVTQFAEGIEAYTAKIRGINATPVYCEILPGLSGTAQLTGQYNQWLRDYCAAEGIHLIPLHTAFVDPATGTFKAALTNDGTHPRNGTNRQIAQVAWNTISPHIPEGGVQFPTMHGDPNNLIANGLFLGGTQGTTGAGGTLMPAGWTAAPSRNANTRAYLEAPSEAEDLIGRWFTLEGTGATTGEFRSIPLPVEQVKPNHTYRLVFKYKATGLRNANSGGGPTLLGRVFFNGVSTGDAKYDKRALGNLAYDSVGTAVLDFVAPSDAVSAVFSWGLNISAASTYKVSLGQLGVYDLTDMSASVVGAKHTPTLLDGQSNPPVTPPVLATVSDDFNRPDGTLGSATTGQAWISSPAATPFTISGNRAAQPDATNNDTKTAYLDGGHADGIARTVLPVAPALGVMAGVTVRGSTEGDGYVFYASSGSGGTFVIARRAWNSFTNLATKAQAVKAGDVLELEASGETLIGKVNGTEVIRASDATHLTGKFVGLFTYGQGVRAWDDFSWRTL